MLQIDISEVIVKYIQPKCLKVSDYLLLTVYLLYLHTNIHTIEVTLKFNQYYNTMLIL
jgi:hypothetical protein